MRRYRVTLLTHCLRPGGAYQQQTWVDAWQDQQIAFLLRLR